MAQMMTGPRPINPTTHAARVALLQAAQPLWARGYDRETGERVYLVPSQTAAGKYHVVTAGGCDCRSWQYRGACAHHSAAMATMRAAR
jgi:hypothetical protein